MFNIKKVKLARRILQYVTGFLFKLFQINLRYREKRKDYNLELFEYFYLPWRTDEEFNELYKIFADFTLNPKSRLYTIYDFSIKYLKENTAFIEVGTWKGGVTGILASKYRNNNIDIYACDTFSGVAKTSDKDTFFSGSEYSDAEVNDLKKIENLAKKKINIIPGIFPQSMQNVNLSKKFSFAHIDVDTYQSAKQSFEYITNNSIVGAVIILDDYGGWFTDGITLFGNELMKNNNYFSVPNHLGQLIVLKLK